MKKNIIILLTACINPNGMCCTVLQDSKVRQKQYEEALLWYLNNTDFKIVFVENTGVDFSGKFVDYINNGRLEYINFYGNDYPKYMGKGYGEANIINESFIRSKWLKNADYVIKITGRLIVLNINVLTHDLYNEKNKNNNKVYCMCGINSESTCPSYFFISPPLFLLNYFLKYKDCINDEKSVSFEHILYKSIVDWLNSKNLYYEFYYPISIKGMCGGNGIVYKRPGFKQYLKSFLRGLYINVVKQNKYIFNM